jgi:HK97 family phage prohead protease
MTNEIKTKDISSKIEDVTDEGIVTIYVNAFNNVDSQNEISDPKSFNKTISDGIQRIKHLKDHDQYKLLGLPIEMKPDSFGLLVRSAMNLKKDLAKDVFEDYKFFANYKRTLEHSIGTVTIKSVPEGQYTRILEYALYEYSTLSFMGANPETMLVSLKNENPFQQVQMFNEMLKYNYTDERLKSIEENIKLIKKSMADQCIVKCPNCGFVFDYNSCDEVTVDSLVANSINQYIRWTIDDTVYQQMNQLKPEIQAEVINIINSTKDLNLAGMYNHVKCQKCYSIVTKQSLANSEPVITQKDKPIDSIDFNLLTKNFKIQ